MAIVEMTRVSIVGPIEDRDAALEAVREGGVLHVLERGEAAPEPADLVSRRARVAGVLGSLPPGDDAEDAERWPGPDRAEAILERLEKQLAERDAALAHLDGIERERVRIDPWGGVQPEALRDLAERGVKVQVFEGREKELAGVDLGELPWARTIALPGGRVRVLAVTPAEVTLPLVPLEPPSRSRAQLDVEHELATVRLDRIGQALVEAGAWRGVLQHYLRWIDDLLTLRRIRERLDASQPLFVLDGYCPTGRVEQLRTALHACDLVLVMHPPGEADDIPIALRNGPIVRTFEPLVAAFKLPSYGEIDPTPLLAPFMGLFFGLCLGDLGYGVLLTVIAGAVLLRGGVPESARVLLRWALVLGVSATIMGALLGNLFGLRIHEMFGLSPQALLFSLTEDPRRLLVLSLGLGVLQLSLGMALRLWRDLRRHRLQAALGSLAWLWVIPTVGLAVAEVWSWWPLGVVCGVLLLFAAPEPRLGRRLGRGAWALYDITGVLANVASYARIFGLGLSSGIIAMVINTVAAVLAVSPVGTVAAVVLLVLGHAFNFAMAVVGSVVHPARLQLLEFFNTFFEGGGRAYAPLRRTFHGK